MNAVLWSTAAFTTLAGGFAAHAVGASHPVALLVGAVFGTVHLAVDRALVAGMASAGSTKRAVAAAIPRLVLAVIIGTIIATPLMLQVFHREIDAEVGAIQREAAASFATALDRDPRFSAIPHLARGIAEIECDMHGYCGSPRRPMGFTGSDINAMSTELASLQDARTDVLAPNSTPTTVATPAC